MSGRRGGMIGARVLPVALVLAAGVGAARAEPLTEFLQADEEAAKQVILDCHDTPPDDLRWSDVTV